MIAKSMKLTFNPSTLLALSAITAPDRPAPTKKKLKSWIKHCLDFDRSQRALIDLHNSRHISKPRIKTEEWTRPITRLYFFSNPCIPRHSSFPTCKQDLAASFPNLQHLHHRHMNVQVTWCRSSSASSSSRGFPALSISPFPSWDFSSKMLNWRDKKYCPGWTDIYVLPMEISVYHSTFKTQQKACLWFKKM